jgi:hypothetical protein
MIKMASNMNMQSVTIDDLVAPWRQPPEISGSGLEGQRIERLQIDRTRRGR